MSEILNVYVSENKLVEATSSLIVPTVVATPMLNGVFFSWNVNVDIRPNLWQVRTKIGAGDWDVSNANWALGVGTTINNGFTRYLGNSDDDKSVIYAEVRSTDGTSFSATTASSSTCLGICDNANVALPTNGVLSANIKDGEVGATKLAVNAVTETKILNGTVTVDKIGALAVTNAKVAVNAIGTTNIIDDAVTVDKIGAGAVDATALGALAVTEAKINTGAVTEGKIGAAAVAYSKLKSDATEKMFANTSDLAALEKVLFGTASTKKLADLDIGATPDKILILNGDNANVGTLATDIKTALSLGNVDYNYSWANLLVNALTEANITTAANAWLNTVWDAFIAAAGQNDSIPASAILTVKSSHVVKDSTTTALFDSSGNYTAGALTGVGIKDTVSGDVITPAKLRVGINATTGYAQNLDLSSIVAGSGTLDNIPDGITNKLVPANSKLGADYAYSGLHTNGAQKVGIYSGGTNYTVAQIANQIIGHRDIWTNFKDNVAGVTALDALTVVGTGAYIAVKRHGFVAHSGDAKLTFTGTAHTTASASGVIRLLIYDTAGALITSGADSVLIGLVEANISCSVTPTPVLTNGTPYVLVLQVKDTGSNVVLTPYAISASIA